MRQLVRGLGVVLLASVALAADGSAQEAKRNNFYLGGGATMPLGDYGEYAKTGWMADVGVGRTLGSGRLFAFADVFYGKNSHETEDESTTLMGGGANLGIQSSGSATRLYGYVGAGLQNHKYNPAVGDSESETKPYGRGAVGISLGSGNTTFWAEVGMVMGDTSYLPIIAGVSIGW